MNKLIFDKKTKSYKTVRTFYFFRLVGKKYWVLDLFWCVRISKHTLQLYDIMTRNNTYFVTLNLSYLLWKYLNIKKR